ncbi:MAG TPA: transposase [Nitrososphaera sp.]|jgi:hypothetical protein
MSIGGVDYYLASLLSSYIGDVNRFPTDDHLASYFGMVPTCKQGQRQHGTERKDGKGGTADFRSVIDVSVAGGVDLRPWITSFTGQEGLFMLRTNYQGTVQGTVVCSQYSSFATSPAVCVVAVAS